MDFSETLIAASQNERQKTAPSSYYRAKFDPPKKEQKQKSLSANIQKFLAKKEEEERIKAQEANRKREELLAMRDPKATRKIQKMLKVIKSANKSVLADAIDTENTAVTRDGPDQPDEDDYGYTSQEASALYQKMMEKYSKAPVEEKFPSSGKSGARDLNKARDRVREALLRQQEEEEGPHRRTRKPKEGSSYEPEKESYTAREEEEKKEERPKVRKPLPPPLDFNQLLKIAAEKKSQPLVIPVKKSEKEPEPERLMTKKQKREYEEEQARREARQRRLQEKESGSKDPKTERSRPQNPTNQHNKPTQAVFNRIPKLSEREKNVSTNKTSSNDDIRKVGESKDDYLSTKMAHSKPKEGTPKLSVSKSKHVSDSSEYRKAELKHSNAERMPNGKSTHKEKTGYEEPQRSKLESYLKQKKLEDTKNLFGDRSSSKQLSKSSSNNSIASKDSRNVMKPKQSDHLHSDKRKETSSSQSGSQVKSSNVRPSLPPSKTDDGKWRQPEGKSTSKSQPPLESKQRPMSSSDRRPRPPVVENRPRAPVSDNRPRPTVSENKSRPPTLSDNKSRPPPVSANKSRPLSVSDNKSRPVSASEPNRSKPISMSENKSRPLPAVQNKLRPSPVNDSKLKTLPQQNPKKFSEKSRPFPPPDVRGTNGVAKVRLPQEGKSGAVRQFPPPDMRPARKFPPPGMKQRNKSHAPKRRLDSESEYDSELDDFIDDGPADAQDVSSYIRDIFGYDRNKYKDFDDDDHNMESNFAQVMREEYISKKIGILEDLEDMRLEAEEKKKKAKKRRRLDDED